MIPLVRASAVMTGLAIGLALGPLLATGRILEVAWAVALGAIVIGAAMLLVPRSARRALIVLALLALALRMGSAVLLHLGSIALGMDGFVTGDDREYFVIADGFVSLFNGEVRDGIVPPYWGGRVYLFGTWVYLESAIFFVFGPRPLLPILLNAAIGAVTVILLYDVAQRWWGHRAGLLAACALCVVPTIVLWSALNLKDALALALIVLVFSALARFRESPRILPLTFVLAALWATQSLRLYVFVGLALIIPLAVALAQHRTGRARLRWTASAAAVTGLLLFSQQSGLAATPHLVGEAEYVRRGMAAGARTSFQEPPPLRVSEGTTFVVPGTPLESPRIVHVPQNAELVLRTPQPKAASGSGGGGPVVEVRPGDVIVIGPSTVTPGPERIPIQLDPGGPSVQLAPADGDHLVLRTLGYLPKGMLYTLFAPWPWLSDRGVDLLLLPEMLAWYAVLAALALTMWQRRERWRSLAPAVLFIVGTVTVLALFEGNWATLLRHRSMVAPLSIAISSATILDLWAARRPRSSAATSSEIGAPGSRRPQQRRVGLEG